MSERGPVLITGGTGFIGTRVAKRMVDESRSVHLLVRSGSNRLQTGDLENKLYFHDHDGSTTGLLEILKTVRPQSILHLASSFVAEHSSEDIRALIVSNVLFGTQLLEAMKAADVRLIVNTGTSWQHYHSQLERPSCLYAAAKQAFQDILSFYCDAYGFHASTLKLFDTYGPRDPRRKLFWLLNQAADSGEPLSMSPGEQQIDLVYIDDVVEAFLLAESRLSDGTAIAHEVFAISSGQAITLRRVVELYREVLGRDVPVHWGARPYRTREVMVPWRGGHALPGWKAKTDILTGLRRMQADHVASIAEVAGE